VLGLLACDFLRRVTCCYRCSSGRCLSSIWVRDGTYVCTRLGRWTNNCCHFCIIHTDIGNVVKMCAVSNQSYP